MLFEKEKERYGDTKPRNKRKWQKVGYSGHVDCTVQHHSSSLELDNKTWVVCLARQTKLQPQWQQKLIQQST